MKVTIVIICLMILKTKASYLEEFRGAMSSVENAFGKLLNDVVTDVKSTVHCTILAMERVLAMNGVVSEPLEDNECYTENASDVDPQNTEPAIYSSNDFAAQINSSISRVNETLSNILDNSDHERLQTVKKELENESNRLTEVSFLLRQELEKVSHRMRTDFQSLNSDKPSIESLWNDMKLLYEVEKNDRNISEVKEIGQVLDEALNVLQITPSNDKSDGDKMKAIMLELEHESNDKNASSINIINSELSQLTEKHSVLQNESLSHKSKPEETSKSNDKTHKDIENNISDSSSKSVHDKLLIEETQTTTVRSKSTNAISDEYSAFGGVNSADIEAIDEAVNILKDSVQTQKLIDNLFSNNIQGPNVFDNTDLLDFS